MTPRAATGKSSDTSTDTVGVVAFGLKRVHSERRSCQAGSVIRRPVWIIGPFPGSVFKTIDT